MLRLNKPSIPTICLLTTSAMWFVSFVYVELQDLRRYPAFESDDEFVGLLFFSVVVIESITILLAAVVVKSREFALCSLLLILILPFRIYAWKQIRYTEFLTKDLVIHMVIGCEGLVKSKVTSLPVCHQKHLLAWHGYILRGRNRLDSLVVGDVGVLAGCPDTTIYKLIGRDYFVYQEC